MMLSKSHCLTTLADIPSCLHALPSLIDFFTAVYSASVNRLSTIPIPHKIGDIASSSPSMVHSSARSSLKSVYHSLILSSLSLTFMMPFLAVLLSVISLNNLQLFLCLNSSSAVSTYLIILSRSSILVLYCSCNLPLCLSTSSLLLSVGLQYYLSEEICNSPLPWPFFYNLMLL